MLFSHTAASSSMNRVEKLLAEAGGKLEADAGAHAFDLRADQRWENSS